jgi:nicotinate-nucleotide pyrophosphorylase (carboxylating)
MHTTDDLIELALKEDIGPGDITTDNIVEPDTMGKAAIIAKQDLILAGIQVAERVFSVLDRKTDFNAAYVDGDFVAKGDIVVRMEGSLATLLKGERTALNFLQRLSGIATQTKSYMNEVTGTSVKLVDTRKTTPGWRVLEKYAVRIGGAHNHRMGLYDGVLIKDNHIAVAGGITHAVKRAREAISHLVKVEVEASTLEEVNEALYAGADIIMLDNMSLQQIKEAVGLIDHRALVEVSGGVTLKQLRNLAQTGVDLISIGALTHSAVAVDLSMTIEPIT